jgi:hypothetical protein
LCAIRRSAILGRTAHSIMPSSAEPDPISRFLADDHVRLDTLLRRATADPAAIDRDAYHEFRAGLLRHIAMEEKVLLPEAQRLRGGEPLPVAARLRLDHGAIAALLVPTPTPVIIAALRVILAAHNPVEEGPDGLYATCDRLAGPGAAALVERLRATPPVPVSPYSDGPRVMDAIRRALARAGYDLADHERPLRR